MTVWHSSSGSRIKLAQPQTFMAQEHETVETAYAGDIIGLFDPGIFRLGDTLCEGAPVATPASRCSRRNSSAASAPWTP
jgi:peptide chain release factor 3